MEEIHIHSVFGYQKTEHPKKYCLRWKIDEILYVCLLKNCQNLNGYNSKLRFLRLNIQKFITESKFLGRTKSILFSGFSRNRRCHELDFDQVKIRALFPDTITYVDDIHIDFFTKKYFLGQLLNKVPKKIE